MTTDLLHRRCKEAWSYLKSHPGKKLSGIAPRPWVLLLGLEHSGKTSLLGGSAFHFSSPHNLSLESPQPTQSVDWWASPEAVFIEPASDISLNNLLNILKDYRYKNPIQHVILTIDLPSLIHLSNETIDQFTLQLHTLQAAFKMTPISIVITKCDKLIGFSAMFDDLSSEQRNQVFGIQFTRKDRKAGLSLSFNQSFSQLLNRIKSRLMNRLHREQSLERRRQIFRFIAEPAPVIKPLEKLMSHLPFSNSLPLHGIYFTSIHHHRAYFINDSIKSIVQQSTKPSHEPAPHSTQRLLAFPIAAVIIFGLTLLWETSYNKTIQIINTVQENIASSTNHLPKNLLWLSQINKISNALTTMRQKQPIPFKWIGLTQVSKMEAIANAKYQTLLDKQFKPYLQTILLNQVQLGMKGDKLALFDALRAYLSSSRKKHYDKDIIKNWYQIYWKALYPDNLKLQNLLDHHLSELLASNNPLWSADEKLIQEARDSLQKLPLADLAFLELQGQYDPINVPISNNNYPGISLKNATIPQFFTIENSKKILNQQIPNITSLLSQGNWVLGTKTGVKISESQKSEVIKKLKSMYLAYYANVWAESIIGIRLTPADSTNGVIQQINNITNPKSDLNQVLNLVIKNASMDKGASNKSLTAIKELLSKSGRYSIISKVLKDLKDQLQKISQAEDYDKVSFEIAKKRFKQGSLNDPISAAFSEAKNDPDPIESWITTIAQSSWKVILKNTRSYLNTVWSTIVLPLYSSEINNRYPVFENSDDNITLKNFTSFFGPNGAVGTFFIYYLQNFVDTEKNYWTWKSLNGESLGISQKDLNSFIRASIIQQMFYTDNQNKPGFQFILVPLKLSGNATQFTMHYGDQTYNVTKNSNTKMKFSWPISATAPITIQFVTSSGSQPTTSYQGPWAWFRLVNASTLQTTRHPALFQLTIHNGSNAISFNVITDHRINPMVPGVIGKYRCPKAL